MAKHKRLPQDVWEAVIAVASATKRKAPAEELAVSAAQRQARRRHGLSLHPYGVIRQAQRLIECQVQASRRGSAARNAGSLAFISRTRP